MDTIDITTANAPTYSPWYYMLNGKLVKERKPCLPGQYIHLKSWDGLYKVHNVTVFNLSIMRNRKLTVLPWDEFRCLEGQGSSLACLIKRKAKEMKTANVHQLNKIVDELYTMVIKANDQGWKQ